MVLYRGWFKIKKNPTTTIAITSTQRKRKKKNNNNSALVSSHEHYRFICLNNNWTIHRTSQTRAYTHSHSHPSLIFETYNNKILHHIKISKIQVCSQFFV